jgi:hypothetical protein
MFAQKFLPYYMDRLGARVKVVWRNKHHGAHVLRGIAVGPAHEGSSHVFHHVVMWNDGDIGVRSRLLRTLGSLLFL